VGTVGGLILPWDLSDVEKYNKGLSKKQKEQWVAAANSSRESCLKKGKAEKECDAQAIRIANAVVKAYGGPGSGNFGHAGRKGKVGGSAPGGGKGGGGVLPTKESIPTNEAVEFYQDQGFVSINEGLRKGNVDADIQPYVDVLDSAIGLGKEKDVYVFRGDGAAISAELFSKTGIGADLKGSPLKNHDDYFNRKSPTGGSWDAYFTDKMKGAVFEDKGFVSCSFDKKIATDKFVSGGEVSEYGVTGLVQIMGRSKILRASDFSSIDTEKEGILPRSTKFKINRVSLVPMQREGYSGARGEVFYLQYDVEIVR
jgi:hypothetical protein